MQAAVNLGGCWKILIEGSGEILLAVFEKYNKRKTEHDDNDVVRTENNLDKAV